MVDTGVVFPECVVVSQFCKLPLEAGGAPFLGTEKILSIILRDVREVQGSDETMNINDL